MDELIPLDQRPADEQRAILAERLGQFGVERLEQRVERGVPVDGQKARPIVAMPTSSGGAGSRDARVRHADGVRYVELAQGVVDVDDHVSTPNEMIAAADARIDDLAGRTYDGIAECARGARVSGPKRNVDRNGRAKPLRGKSTEQLYEQLMQGDAAVGGRPRPALVGARVTHAAKAALDDDQTASNGEVMDEVAIVMIRTGMTKREVISALERVAETGLIDPAIVEAMPPTASTESAA